MLDNRKAPRWRMRGIWKVRRKMAAAMAGAQHDAGMQS
jgi:hypothetical protein